jgi:dihydrofolate synthase / folylpolyglutamate synthase
LDFADAVEHLLARGRGRMVPDLSRITLLAELLGNPQLAYPTVHITGTNGKGSATRIVSTLLTATGLKAGAYTSPHLQTVRERLQIAGRPISERRFAEVYTELQPIVELVEQRLDEPITYFEMLTAMAYWWFADEPVDVAVFEVGMGGTWDATNLVRGEVAVIQPVDVDHVQLGRTAVEAAGEKSGIIKPGSVVVSARQRDDVAEVISRQAEAREASVAILGEGFEVEQRRIGVGGQMLVLRIGDRVIDEVFLPLFGPHQADNAAVSLAAVAAFLGDAFEQVDDDVIRQAFGAVSVPGRLEIVRRDPTVLLDGAHNPHGAAAAAQAIEEAFDFRTLIAVLGVLEDKDVDGIVEGWQDVVNHVIVTPVPTGRSATTERVAAAASAAFVGTGVVVEVATDVDDALDKAEGLAGEGDGVLVTGSLYLVGAVRDRYLPVEDTGDEVIYEPEDLDTEEDEAAFQEALDRMLDSHDGDGPAPRDV